MGTKSEHQINREQRIRKSQGRVFFNICQQFEKKKKKPTQTGAWAYKTQAVSMLFHKLVLMKSVVTGYLKDGLVLSE